MAEDLSKFQRELQHLSGKTLLLTCSLPLWTCKEEDTEVLENNTSKTVSFGSNNNTLSLELPFFNLNLDEFLKVTGSWVFSATDLLLGKKDLFKDALESPNRCDDCHNYVTILSSLSIVQSNKLVWILIRLKNKADFQSCTVTCAA